MRRLPKRVSGTTAHAAWCNQLLDFVASLVPQNSPNTLTKHGVNGVVRESKAKGKTGGTSEFVWL